MRRSGIKRTRFKRKPPPPKDYDLQAAERFRRAVCHAKAVCAVCGARNGLQAHHGVPKSAIEDFAREERLSNEARNALLWDPANGIAVCLRCHERHTNAFSRIPLRCVSATVFAFAESLNRMATRRGSGWATSRIEREYDPAA